MPLARSTSSRRRRRIMQEQTEHLTMCFKMKMKQRTKRCTKLYAVTRFMTTHKQRTVRCSSSSPRRRKRWLRVMRPERLSGTRMAWYLTSFCTDQCLRSFFDMHILADGRTTIELFFLVGRTSVWQGVSAGKRYRFLDTFSSAFSICGHLLDSAPEWRFSC